MKPVFCSLLLSIYLFGSIGCQAQDNQPIEVLASKGGFQISEEDFQLFVRFMNETYEMLGISERETLKQMFVEDFLEDPEVMVGLLDDFRHVDSNTKTILPEELDETSIPPNIGSQPKHQNNQEGFLRIRQMLDPENQYTDFFENPRANHLRQYLKNSILAFEDSYSAGGTIGGGSNFQETIQLCSDGTFVMRSNSWVGIGGGMDRQVVQINGLWETGLQSGQTLLNLYSTHQEFIRINPRGFIPMLIKSYDHQAVRIASEEGDKFYRRSATSGCY